MNSGVKVFAPASVANVACGFDILGFALNEPGDEIIARFSDNPGLKISRIIGDKGRLPLDIKKNTAGFAALKFLEFVGETKRGIEIEIHKKMPFCSGLGSSAASSVAGVMAVNELLHRPLSKRELLPFAVLGEQVADNAFHADNVAPCLLGGIILIRDNQSLDIQRLPVPKGLFASVIYPHIEVLTKNARNILTKNISLYQSILQTGNLGGFIVGLYNSDFDLIKRSLQDVIIEPQRASLIPHFFDVKNAALKHGSLGCSISGAGPSLFALSQSSLIAEQVGLAMKNVFNNFNIDSDLYISSINQDGATLF
jgi:homoserine kinase